MIMPGVQKPHCSPCFSQKASWIGCSFDRGDLRAVGLDGQHGAGLHGLAIQVNGAGAALARVAAHVRAREPGQLADEMHEEEPGLDVMRVSDAIDGHGRFHCAYLLRRLDADWSLPPRHRGVRGRQSAQTLVPGLGDVKRSAHAGRVQLLATIDDPPSS